MNVDHQIVHKATISACRPVSKYFLEHIYLYEVLSKIDAHDPGGQYSVNYMYGTTGIGYNTDKVDEDEVTSWSVLFDPAIASKYEDCGIAMLDAPSEVMEIALKYVGKDPNTEDENDYKVALSMLQEIRPFIRYFDSSQYIDDLANGEI